MAAVTDEQLAMLAMLITKEIKKEFAGKKMSGNLFKTVNITQDASGEIHVNIPAHTYNMKLYQTQGVVKHISNGSYANFLDQVGSEFNIYDENGRRVGRSKPHNHIGYIERVILAAIREWMSFEGIAGADTIII